MENRFKLPALPSGIGRALLNNIVARAKGAFTVLTMDTAEVMSPALLLDTWADKTPSHVLLRFEGDAWTYAEIRERVRTRAATLRRAGLGWGHVVAVVMQNHPEYVVDILAISWIGATASLVNTGLTGASLSHALLQTSPNAIIAGRDFVGAIDDALGDVGPAKRFFVETQPDGAATQGSIDRWQALARLDTESERDRETGARVRHPARVLGAELFAYIFTSGTTGLPKGGKIMNARALLAGTGIGVCTLGLSQADTIYVCLPLFHASGIVVGICGALEGGATVALTRRFSTSRFWDDIERMGATTFVYIGEICRYLLSAPPHPRERAHAVRAIVGNGMRPDVWPRFVERFGIPFIHEFYAATEGNVNIMNFLGVEGSVGRMPPIINNAFLAKFDPDTELPARDARGRCIPCKAGEVGELLGRIDASRVISRFDGYVNDDATRAKILRDVEQKGDAFFRSGDLMRKDIWGFYYFVDRIGDTFRWKGENVATNEVQDAIGKHDDVESANVFGVAIPGADGRAGMAALALKQGACFSPDRFYEHVTRLLPAYAIPAFVRLLSEAEVTATFKLKKTDLVRAGFDPTKTEDLLFYRDDRKRTYDPIDAAIHASIATGRIRF